MAAATTQAVSVGTSATQITSSALPYAAPDSRCVMVSNIGANPIYLGGANVTATTGVLIPAGTTLPFTNASLQGLYGIATTAASTLVIGVF